MHRNIHLHMRVVLGGEGIVDTPYVWILRNSFVAP